MLRVFEPIEQDLHDGQHHVQTDQIAQRQRPYRVIGMASIASSISAAVASTLASAKTASFIIGQSKAVDYKAGLFLTFTGVFPNPAPPPSQPGCCPLFAGH